MAAETEREKGKTQSACREPQLLFWKCKAPTPNDMSTPEGNPGWQAPFFKQESLTARSHLD